MPPDDSFWSDDDESLSPARPNMAKQNPEQAVGVAEPGPWLSLLQDSELLAQSGIFDSQIKS